jgi:hypothetical protein
LDKMEQHKVPFLYNFSPSIVPPPLDWYEWIRVTGPSTFVVVLYFELTSMVLKATGS